ncbi:hypothetical protein Dshi_4222 (plasmid) [Dinoroseobacter shibae DFL 12 = DSM 16493]|jgi:hypothetical protein|uniref:Uncharacterized protein n=1 Tax=Dinoroseobacter shibae (strain DSM 16493 / NCIMB 14021 / DFL 12) TaxID=398580 RepID=A8LUL5_DINSH|nr:hypothetical protein [Dinoroseobacter shibae]ABV95932.1 hypothetical protein Dshi_4222 [Dinoroseobacter shibae DFL 12 = DSM 16493]URF49174.1 hypothetical protein M8008_21585 [Dinoroseobacter shibae]URF53482.1 hypothetical protein M8007_21610 [Dinoroseobacter shibae]
MSLHAVQTPAELRPARAPERPVSALSETGRARLAALREAARVARARPYRSLEATCLSERGRTDPYESLVECLPEAVARPLVIYRGAEDSLSFDEAWILTMLERIDSTDWDSLHFLIARRVCRPFRVAVRVLLGACQDG